MSKLICVQLDDETKVYFETTNYNITKTDPMLEEASSGDWIIDKTTDYVDRIISNIKFFSSSIAESIRNLSDEVEVEFSIKLAADAGIIISSVSTESCITVRLKWEKAKQED